MSLAVRIGDLATAIGQHIRDQVAPRLIPAGGASGHVLRKASATDYALEWAAAAGGASGPDLYQRLGADRAGVNGTADQDWFAAGAAGVAVEAATYRIEGSLWLASGATSHSVGLSFGGSAVVAAIAYDAINTSAANNTAGTTQSSTRVTQTANTTVTQANTTQNKQIRIDGLVTFSQAGIFVPRFRYSAAPGSSTVSRGTFFGLTKLEAETRGSWS